MIMKDEEVIKDYGSWVFQKNWNEVDLRTYQEIEKYYSGTDKEFDLRDILHILTNKPMDEINELPIEFAEKILEKLSFLFDKPEWGNPTNEIKIDGEKYFINVMEKLKTGEYVAVDTILKTDKHNYSAILAVLCRKEGEIYDSKFEAEVFEKRVELFQKQSLLSIMPIISFFLNLYIVSRTPSLLFSELEEGLNLIQQNIDNSPKIGAFKRRSLNLQMKKLRKLVESNKNT